MTGKISLTVMLSLLVCLLLAACGEKKKGHERFDWSDGTLVVPREELVSQYEPVGDNEIGSFAFVVGGAWKGHRYTMRVLADRGVQEQSYYDFLRFLPRFRSPKLEAVSRSITALNPEDIRAFLVEEGHDIPASSFLWRSGQVGYFQADRTYLVLHKPGTTMVRFHYLCGRNLRCEIFANTRVDPNFAFLLNHIERQVNSWNMGM